MHACMENMTVKNWGLAILLTVFTSSLFLIAVSGQRGLANFRWFMPSPNGLAVSGHPTEAQILELRNEDNITAILNVEQETGNPYTFSDEEYATSLGIQYLYLGWEDDTAPTWEIADIGVEWINARLGEGRNVLIHCGWGVGRAPTMACLWRVREGYTASEAIEWANGFNQTGMSPSQEAFIHEYAYPEMPEFPLGLGVLIILGGAMVVFLQLARKRRR